MGDRNPQCKVSLWPPGSPLTGIWSQEPEPGFKPVPLFWNQSTSLSVLNMSLNACPNLLSKYILPSVTLSDTFVNNVFSWCPFQIVHCLYKEVLFILWMMVLFSATLSNWVYSFNRFFNYCELFHKLITTKNRLYQKMAVNVFKVVYIWCHAIFRETILPMWFQFGFLFFLFWLLVQDSETTLNRYVKIIYIYPLSSLTGKH